MRPCTHTCLCTHMHTHAHVGAYPHTHLCTRLCTPMHITHAHVCVHTCLCTHTPMHTSVHAHTHTQHCVAWGITGNQPLPPTAVVPGQALAQDTSPSGQNRGPRPSAQLSGRPGISHHCRGHTTDWAALAPARRGCWAPPPAEHVWVGPRHQLTSGSGNTEGK